MTHYEFKVKKEKKWIWHGYATKEHALKARRNFVKQGKTVSRVVKYVPPKQKFIKAKDLAKKLGYKHVSIGRYGIFVSGKIRRRKK